MITQKPITKTVKLKKTTVKKKSFNKEKLLTSLSFETPLADALGIIQHYILNPKHSAKYSQLTYVDEVVLLCLLKDVPVTYNDDDGEYTIDGQIVSSSIDKLIEKGYIHYDTLKPNKVVLKRLYINHPFSDKSKYKSDNTIRQLLDYDVIEDFEQTRSKWKAVNFFITLSNSMELPRFKNERISFTTFINIAANKPRTHIPKKKFITKHDRFDFNVARLEQITSILLNEIIQRIKE